MFQFFGFKLLIGLAVILVVLLTLVYYNQNKILYIPRISRFMQSFQELDFLLPTIQLAGDIPPSRAASHKTWKSALRMDLHSEDGCSPAERVNASSSTSIKMQAVSIPLCRYRTQNEVSQQHSTVHQLRCFDCCLSRVFGQRRHANLTRTAKRFRGCFGLGDQLQEQKVGKGEQRYEDFCIGSKLGRSSVALRRNQVSLCKGDLWPDFGKHLHQYQRNDPCHLPNPIAFHLPADQLLALQGTSSLGQATHSLHQIAQRRNSPNLPNGVTHQQRNKRLIQNLIPNPKRHPQRLLVNQPRRLLRPIQRILRKSISQMMFDLFKKQ